MTDHTTDRVLHALYCLSRDTCQIDATELARAVDITATQAARALVQLERRGWVDASRARLTMLGLARAVSMPGQGSGGPSVNLSHARPRARQRAFVAPLAAAAVAQPERSRATIGERAFAAVSAPAEH